MIDLLIATANRAKVREFREMLGDSGINWSEIPADTSADTFDVEETGKTFRANACLKASAYAKHFNRWALADDSGLEVDALDNAPGVYSARWATMQNASDSGEKDADNNRLLLKQLESVPDEKRGARFVCVLALSNPAGQIVLTARDSVSGRIIRAPRGGGGFGYDPLFLVESSGKTTAELSPSEKHAISHRGKALVAMKQLMRECGLIEQTV
ncbi:MAG: RdgB/HAM1 family non-canonical purine NTP pyrophosphatase [Anaerolineae bacterium]|nr:RdgB/HAM1 family non-canonical purine NTP pyrophosphatase [Phycisphaerae bacterium]